MSVRPLARLRALGILTGTWWLHQTMFPSGLCVFVGPMLVLSIMGGVEGAQTAARCGTIVLGIAGGMEPVGRLGARRGTITALGLMGGMEGGQTAFGMTAVRVPAHRHLRVPWNHGQRREMLVTKGAEVAF